MFCIHCGAALTPGGRFCPQCGCAGRPGSVSPSLPRGAIAGFAAALLLVGGLGAAWQMGARSSTGGPAALQSPPAVGPRGLGASFSPVVVAAPAPVGVPVAPAFTPAPFPPPALPMQASVAPAALSPLPLADAAPPASRPGLPLAAVASRDPDLPPSHVLMSVHADQMPPLMPLNPAFQPPAAAPAPIQVASVNPVLPPVAAQVNPFAARSDDFPPPAPIARRLPMRFRADAWRLTRFRVPGRQVAFPVDVSCHPSRAVFLMGRSQGGPLNREMGCAMNRAGGGGALNQLAP